MDNGEAKALITRGPTVPVMVNTTTAAGLIGVVLLARHGDSTTYYQDPTTYNATQAYITPLGEVRTLRYNTASRSRMFSNKNLNSGVSFVIHISIPIRRLSSRISALTW
jgi:hypothetical protein